VGVFSACSLVASIATIAGALARLGVI